MPDLTSGSAGIVIAGAGLAGLSTAEKLRDRGYEGRLTLVGAEPHRPYSRPPLSKEYLTGKGRGTEVALRDDTAWQALEIEPLLGRTARALDTRDRAVTLDDGTRVGYDALVIATGAAARHPGTDLAGVHVMRTVEDAAAIRAAFDEADRVVVVGAGFVGAEVAASARQLGLEVTLLEAAPTPLTRAIDPRVGTVLTDLHRDNGVDVRLGVSVTAYEGAGRVERVRLSDDTSVETSLVVAGIGVELNTGWLAGSGVELVDAAPGGVRCDRYCATSVPDVYAAGDLANWPHPRYGGRLRLEHWTNASEQAAVVAHNILAGTGTREPYTPVPYFWSDQFGMKLQLLGQAAPADTVEVVHGDLAERKFVAFFGRDGLLVGVLGLRSTPRVMRHRRLLTEPTPWEDALAAVA